MHMVSCSWEDGSGFLSHINNPKLGKGLRNWQEIINSSLQN